MGKSETSEARESQAAELRILLYLHRFSIRQEPDEAPPWEARFPSWETAFHISR